MPVFVCVYPAGAWPSSERAQVHERRGCPSTGGDCRHAVASWRRTRRPVVSRAVAATGYTGVWCTVGDVAGRDLMTSSSC